MYIEHIQASYSNNDVTDSNYDNATKYGTLDQQPYITELHINISVVSTTFLRSSVGEFNKTLIATNPVEDTANTYDGGISGPKLLDTNISYHWMI